MSKIQIRRGVFETNSSSVHSLAIGKTYSETLPKEIIFTSGEYEFSWAFEELTSLEAKAALITLLLQYDDVERRKVYMAEITEALGKLGIKAVWSPNLDLDADDYDEFYSKYKRKWHYKKEYYYDDCEYDHEALNLDVILKDTDLVISFLLSDESIISNGNDNGDKAYEDWEKKVAERKESGKYKKVIDTTEIY